MEEAIDPSALEGLHCYACRGASVTGASGVAAREVLLADTANLLPNVLPRRPGKELDDALRCQSGWGVRVDLRFASRPERESGPPKADRFDCSVRRGDEVKSPWQRAEEQREAKLELIREQVETGSLVIRKMTKEERRRYPYRLASPKRSGRR
jgi:hypothetical protein